MNLIAEIKRMLRSLWSWLTAGESGEQSSEGTEPDETGDDGSGFLPSRLDASVLFTHGGPRPEQTPESEDEREALEAEMEAIEEFHEKK
jgi:hypothetical protein